MNIDFIGLIITVVSALVLGVAANLLTPRVQRFFASASQRAAISFIEKARRQQALFDRYILSPTEFVAYVLSLLVNASIALVILGLIGLMYFTGRLVHAMLFPDFPASFSDWLLLGVALIPFDLVVFWTVSKVSALLNVLSAMRDYHRYKENTEKSINKLKTKYPNIDPNL